MVKKKKKKSKITLCKGRNCGRTVSRSRRRHRAGSVSHNNIRRRRRRRSRTFDANICVHIGSVRVKINVIHRRQRINGQYGVSNGESETPR